MPIRIDTALDAFAIIDCQPAFMPGGSLPTPDGEAVVAVLHPALEATLVDLIIRKGTSAGLEGLSAFSDRGRRSKSGLASMLRERGIERLFLAGLAMDVCVAATAEDAVLEGFTVVLIEDASRPSKPDALDATRSRLGRMNVKLVSERDLSC